MAIDLTLRKLLGVLILFGSIATMGCRGECITCVGDVTKPDAIPTTAAGSCQYNVVSEQKVYPGEGWNGGFSVNTKPENTCQWRAVSRDESCVVITSGHSGVGDGQVNWKLLSNSSRGRECSIDVSGNGWMETVTIRQNPR